MSRDMKLADEEAADSRRPRSHGRIAEVEEVVNPLSRWPRR
jgi:hypothetical protein